MEGLQSPDVRRWQDGHWQKMLENVASEEQIRVVWSGGEAFLWAWPDDLGTLCLGHVLLEYAVNRGIPVGNAEGQVISLSDEPGKRVFQVRLNPLPASRAGFRMVEPGSLSPESLLHAMRQFLELPGACPGLWESTGCFHRAGLFDVQCRSFVHLAEDTGRHNCLDRLVGWACLHGVLPGNHVLFLSSRITGSLMARAQRAGFRFLVGRGAVTSVGLNDGMTVVGFCRPGEGRFTVFQDSGCRVLG